MEYSKEVGGGQLTFGAIENIDLSSRVNLKGKTHLSFILGKYGAAFQTKRSLPGYGPPECTYFHLLVKFTRTTVGLRAKFETTFKNFKKPEIRAIVHSRLGNNFFTRSVYNYPKGGSVNYFGYAYSERLNLGLTIQELGDNSQNGFLRKPFNFGLAVNYQE